MGKDRRKKDAGKKPTASSVSNETDSEPKGQREPRNRADQRKPSKSTDGSVKDGCVENASKPEEEIKTEPVNTAELFANLKRETDDIKALTTKKFSKRQIISNWERYEEPLPEPQYEVEIQGADFESLLQFPVSEGGHFQFKLERTWDADVSSLSGELFSLDVDLLADGLATIPLYKQLDIPTTLLTADEIADMDATARSSLKQFELSKKDVRKTKERMKADIEETTTRLLDLIRPVPTEDKTVLSFDIDQPDAQNEVTENYKNRGAADIDTSSDQYNNKSTKNNSVDEKRPSPPKVPEIREDNSRCLDTSRTVPKTLQNTENTVNKINVEAPEEVKAKEKVLPIHEVLPPRDDKREVLSAGENKEVVLHKQLKKEATPIREVPEDAAPPKVELQQALETESSENVVTEPVIPLGQRTGKRKNRGQIPASETQSQPQPQPSQAESEDVKSQQADDLDFLLSLKKPVRETRISAPQSSQVSKPSIEEDDTEPSKLSTVAPQKQTENLEDWLDSMLDD